MGGFNAWRKTGREKVEIAEVCVKEVQDSVDG